MKLLFEPRAGKRLRVGRATISSRLVYPARRNSTPTQCAKGCYPCLRCGLVLGQTITLAFALKSSRIDSQDFRRCFERGSPQNDARNVFALDFFQRNIAAE